jgi:hypothetical protein
MAMTFVFGNGTDVVVHGNASSLETPSSSLSLVLFVLEMPLLLSVVSNVVEKPAAAAVVGME